MKKIIALILLSYSSLSMTAQQDTSVIRAAKDLVANKKYVSAFKLLEDADPANGKPDIVLLKEDIALNYFVSSMMHQMFAFKDLEPGETIEQFRGSEGSFSMFVFPVDQILDSLIGVYPDDYALYKGLGDFYFDISEKYPGQWLKSDSLLAKLIAYNYKVAIDHGLADEHLYYRDGLEYLYQKNYKEAIPMLLKAISLKNDDADAHYNLAYAYLYMDDRENALKYARNSYDLYRNPRYRGDAARMTGEIYSELKNDKKALEYYEIAYHIDTSSYYNLKPLLDIYVKTGHRNKEKILSAFYHLAPTNPTIYNDLSTIYAENNKISELTGFFKDQIVEHPHEDKILANLYFNLGRLYLLSDKQSAKENFLRSKPLFAEYLDADNTVFQAIEEGIKESESK